MQRYSKIFNYASVLLVFFILFCLKYNKNL
nr:MAG TPA: hypothetical protein [Bacteriophage sp.]